MKKREIMLIFMMMLLLIPIFIVGWYNHPSADDYNYSCFTYEVLEENGNIFELILATLKTSKIFMQEWQGLYSSAIVLSLQPGIFGERFYGLTTIIIFVVLYLGIHAFFKTIYRFIFQVENKKYILLTFFTLFFIIQTIPSTVEGLYWYNGSMNYLFFFSLLLFQISLLIRYWCQEKNGIVIQLSIISFILSGGNHVTAFANILVELMFFVYGLIKKKKRLVIVSLMAGMIGFYINLSAPGTVVRSNQIQYQGNVIKTVYETFVNSFYKMKIWTNVNLILFLLGMMGVMFHEIQQLKINNRKIIGIAILQYIVLAGMMSVPYHAMGYFGQPRITNVVYISFVFMSLIFVVCLLSYIYQNFYLKKYVFFKEKWLTMFLMIFILWIVLFGKNYETSTTMKAISQLNNGILKQYSKELDERVKLYENKALKGVTVKALTVKPNLIYFDDVTENPEDWRNESIRQYYKKDFVVLEKPNW